MSWQVVFADRALRDLCNLDRTVATRVIRAIDRLASEQAGDVKRLQTPDPTWRLRVGDWRVRFRYDYADRTIEVLRILPRGRAYRD